VHVLSGSECMYCQVQRGRRGCVSMLNLHLPLQLLQIITKVECSIPAHDEVYSNTL
jgi:hypothetical protein